MVSREPGAGVGEILVLLPHLPMPRLAGTPGAHPALLACSVELTSFLRVGDWPASCLGDAQALTPGANMDHVQKTGFRFTEICPECETPSNLQTDDQAGAAGSGHWCSPLQPPAGMEIRPGASLTVPDRRALRTHTLGRVGRNQVCSIQGP